MNIHELSTILIKFPMIQPVTSKSAQRALFSFIQPTVSPGYYAHLDLFVKEHGSHNGCAALQSLQIYAYHEIRRYKKWHYEPLNIYHMVKIKKSFRSINISIEHICYLPLVSQCRWRKTQCSTLWYHCIVGTNEQSTYDITACTIYLIMAFIS
jgi:hypothetical protein